jgi:hypothetical protein
VRGGTSAKAPGGGSLGALLRELRGEARARPAVNSRTFAWSPSGAWRNRLKPVGGRRSAHFSLRGFVRLRTKPRKLKHAPLKPMARIVPHFASPEAPSGVGLAHCGRGCQFRSPPSPRNARGAGLPRLSRDVPNLRRDPRYWQCYTVLPRLYGGPHANAPRAALRAVRQAYRFSRCCRRDFAASVPPLPERQVCL